MMRTKYITLSVMALALTGCGIGDSALNPFRWLSQEEPVERLSEVDIAPLIEDRPLVQSVDALVSERLPGGIIIRATGLPPSQGWFDAQLVREVSAAAGTGVIVYSFRARPPEEKTRVSTKQSRELVAGAYLSDIELAGITSIRVLSASNARTVGR